ncbi:hypothetical protein CFP65_5021 [Kitasatospora sp. MMS16-BH015]|uniref:hypothetical protein n=1 Tax=Kitasatospora sp. MMS16-BH015 TaxID=2018025 RepID=UPI000CA1C25C|nr:hypothetical protein [Kitasatospora sp. MMS16-BH015]AUG79734.1 hypothetical protein CFP65_5021 [Kitasatospora sp. MMS16-BH015]
MTVGEPKVPGPRHAVPRVSTRTKLRGKALAIAAMPTALLMGAIPTLAMADSPHSQPNACASAPDTVIEEIPVPKSSITPLPNPSGTGAPQQAPTAYPGTTTATPTASPTAAASTAPTTPVSHPVLTPRTVTTPQSAAQSPQAAQSAKEAPHAAAPAAQAQAPAAPAAQAPAAAPSASAPAVSDSPSPAAARAEVKADDLWDVLDILHLGHKPTPTPAPPAPAPVKTATPAPSTPTPAPSAPAPASSGSAPSAPSVPTAPTTDPGTPGDAGAKPGTGPAAGTSTAPQPPAEHPAGATAAPTASASPSASASGGTKRVGTPAQPAPSASPSTNPNCQVDAHALKANGTEPGIQVPEQSWTLLTSKLDLYHAQFYGVVDVRTATTTKRVLKFVVQNVDIENLDMSSLEGNGVTFHVKGAPGSTSTMRHGPVTMYVERLSGHLSKVIGLPIPIDLGKITLTPTTLPQWLYDLIGAIPIPLDLELKQVTAVQAGQFGGALTIPGMHMYNDKQAYPPADL